MRPEPTEISPEKSVWVLASAAAAALPLAACGGGDSGSNSLISGAPLEPGRSVILDAVAASTSSPVPPTPVQAARFLLQAQFSASDQEIASVQTLGFAKWIQNQIAANHGPTGWDWLNAKGWGDVTSPNNQRQSSIIAKNCNINLSSFKLMLYSFLK